MDVAERHFSLAMKAIFDPDGLFQLTDTWSKRWNELRLLADTIAVRQIRCLLVNNTRTAAVRVWRSHQQRSIDALRNKGITVESYGWKNWQARWASIMATMETHFPLDGTTDAYSIVERPAIEVQNVMPWDHLHHSGYWYSFSEALTKERRALALHIPEEDRAPPEQSPASQVARRSEKYDLYLCLEPHLEYEQANLGDGAHSKQICSALENAVKEFSSRGHLRHKEQYQIRLSKARRHTPNLEASLAILESIWKDNTWRQENWLEAIRCLNYMLYQHARELGDQRLTFIALWELFASEMRPFGNLYYDFESIYNAKSNTKPQASPFMALSSNDVLSPVILTFNFLDHENHASEAIEAQIIVYANMHAKAKPFTLSSLFIKF